MLGALLLVAGVSIAVRADDFVHFESSHVHPLALSLDGSELYAVNTPDARVAFFEIEADGSLGFAGDVPVGIEPVSLAVRPDAPEIWVVNHLSDSLSIVDTIRRRVVATLAVGDEPTDVVFARGRAYVSLAGSEDRLKVYDAETREQVADLVVPGNDPRALAVGPDEAFVHLVVLESGNMTTSIHPSLVAGRVPPPDPPRFITNFPAPRTGLIVGFDAESGYGWTSPGGTGHRG